jgi:hypothetical protein
MKGEKKTHKLLLFDDIKIWGDFVIQEIINDLKKKKWNKILIKQNNVTIGVINDIEDLDYIAVDKEKTKCFRRDYKAIFELTNTDGIRVIGKALIIYLKGV